MIERKQIKLDVEKRIVTGMIVSTNFIRKVKPVYQHKLIEIPYARTVGRWCVDYFDKYGKAPKKHIQDIYKNELRKGKLSEEEGELIGDFLTNISKQYEHSKKFNVDYLYDQTLERFEHQRLKLLSVSIDDALETNDISEAKKTLRLYREVTRPLENSFNPFTDKDAILEAFEEQVDPLFTFPNAVGELLNEYMTREAFIGIMGREKIGKSWWLLEFAMRAAKSRCNVAYFQVGDMSKKQFTRRLHVRLAGRSNLLKYCGNIMIPILDCSKNQDGSCPKCKGTSIFDGLEDKPDYAEMKHLVKQTRYHHVCDRCRRKGKFKMRPTVWYKERPKVSPLTWREGFKLGKLFFESRMSGKDFKVMVFPNNGISVSGINTQLDIWEKEEEFVADVVVIDYADNLDPEPGDEKKETRHQENGKWAAMSALRLKRHCLVVTGTQVSSKSYDAKRLRMKHFSEDKRKFAHVTAMLGLNQSDDEKLAGLWRLGLILAREGSFSSTDEVYALGSLEMGRPCLDSFKNR